MVPDPILYIQNFFELDHNTMIQLDIATPYLYLGNFRVNAYLTMFADCQHLCLLENISLTTAFRAVDKRRTTAYLTSTLPLHNPIDGAKSPSCMHDRAFNQHSLSNRHRLDIRNIQGPRDPRIFPIPRFSNRGQGRSRKPVEERCRTTTMKIIETIAANIGEQKFS
jgi:hypothetical protein